MQERLRLALHRLEVARREQGLTQADLAGWLDVSPAQYSRLEGGVCEMTLFQLLTLCKAMRLEPADVLGPPGRRTSVEISDLRNTVATYEKHLGALNKALGKKDAWDHD